jgi:glycosyltransferase involved in cell wall biosynthesis
MSMRIAFHAPMKPPDHPVPSGDRRVARLFVAALRHAGHRVEIASRLRSRDDATVPGRQARLAALGDRLADRLIRRWRAEPARRPDLWFTYHLYHKAPDLVGPRVAAAFDLPYVVAEASHAPKRRTGPWADGFARAEAALRQAAAVIAVTAVDAEGLAPVVPAGRLHRIAPFLDVAPYVAAAARRAELRARWWGDAPGPWLLAVGMMRDGDKARSFERLAKALDRLGEMPWRLAVVGDGPARDTVLARFDRARLRYLGARPPDQVAELYAAADLYVWPAVNEAYGMAILEAQATGLPVVAGRTGGVPDIVRDGVTGLLVPPPDAPDHVDRLAGAVRLLLHDRRRREEMAEAALRTAAHAHGFDAAAADLDAILAGAAATVPRRGVARR